MQCRWDKIRPPENYDEVVSLIVIACDGKNQAGVFKKVIDKLDEIYGQPQTRKPISVSKLKLKATLKKLSDEMRVKFGGYRPFHILRNWFTTFLGSLYFRTNQGKKYLYELVDMSDTLVLDGRINTVISGTKKQRQELEKALQELENRDDIRFGFFVSSDSVMSCYVRSLDKNHVHFVDGSDGGYTKAAGVLKKKLAAKKTAD
jgi:hypothetical protein